MMLHVQRHGKMVCVQGSQTLPVARSDNKTLRRRVVRFADRDERDCAACHIIQKPNTQ
jgi:hypothetical protein